MNALEQLQQWTTVVADTGDIASIARLKPVDATTNPSLIFKAAGQPEYQELLLKAVASAQKEPQAAQRKQRALREIAVLFGAEILQHIPGLISTEVDARLSFDTEGTYAEAKQLIARYEQAGIARERVLIKIASTWEGIQAAKQLEKEGIHCNLTLLFSFAQAQACADANIFLISPFVGRILDWHKKTFNQEYNGSNDPGVVSVKNIYDYYKQHDIKTVVMGASFRNIDEIIALAGCDKLTISPALIDELQKSSSPLHRALSPSAVVQSNVTALDEKAFRWAMNEDAMATEKLAEGIRLFTADLIKLEQLLDKHLHA